MLIAKYDVDKYPFRLIVRRMFDGFPLEELHKRQLTQGWQLNDQDTSHHKHVYKHLDKEFYDCYYAFIKSISPNLTADDWCAQATPTFRFQAPGTTATREFHRDRDYGHPPQTVNVVIPITIMKGTAAPHVEAAPYVKVFERMEMQPGEMCVFDAANALHGTHVNQEGYTRVSFDFRLLPLRFMPTDVTTINQRVPIAVGHYYKKVTEL